MPAAWWLPAAFKVSHAKKQLSETTSSLIAKYGDKILLIRPYSDTIKVVSRHYQNANKEAVKTFYLSEAYQAIKVIVDMGNEVDFIDHGENVRTSV